MPLISTQKTALKADIAANTNTVIYAGVSTPINQVPNNDDGNFAIAAWYNLDASPAYLVWNTAVQLKAIRAAADISKYTPSDAIAASPSTDLTYSNRAFLCQLKQANAMFLIQGEGVVDATGQQFRQNFSDCMTAIPSGASGANTNAGWGTAANPGAVRLAMQRNASNVEKLFSVQGAGAGAAGNVSTDPRGSATNPDALVLVGPISPADVSDARNS